MNDVAIKVEQLSKMYKLYDKPMDRLKESLGLTKKVLYHEHYALNNINFEIKKGETVGIIGTNGSGKSTLLKIITGVLTSSSGNISVNGKISALLELGAGFNPEYSGLENIYLNGTMMGYTREEMNKKVDSILEFADIGEFINQPVKTYSSGMFARLAFAVAINVEPDILIVDEALSVGDVFFQNKCFRKFEELKKKNTTILFVSHDIGSVKQMCSKVLWIDKGSQVMFDEKMKVCSAYFNAQVENENKENEKYEYNNEKIEDQKIAENKNYSFPSIKINTNSILSDEVKILSTFVTDKQNNIVTTAKVDEEYSICIVTKFNEDLKDIIVGFVFENRKGLRLLSHNIYESRNATMDVKKGETYIIKFKMKMPRFMRDEYVISPAVAKGTQESPIILTWLNNTNKIFIDKEGYNLAILESEHTTDIIDISESSIELY